MTFADGCSAAFHAAFAAGSRGRADAGYLPEPGGARGDGRHVPHAAVKSAPNAMLVRTGCSAATRAQRSAPHSAGTSGMPATITDTSHPVIAPIRNHARMGELESTGSEFGDCVALLCMRHRDERRGPR